MSKVKAITFAFLLLCSLSLPLISAEEPETLTLTGKVYDIDGNIAAKYADRILLLHEGEIVSNGSPSEVLTSENIASVFGVTSRIIPSNGVEPMRILIEDEIREEE